MSCDNLTAYVTRRDGRLLDHRDALDAVAVRTLGCAGAYRRICAGACRRAAVGGIALGGSRGQCKP